MKKYHIALSFAGEDRNYVERVALSLVSKGIDVFYDKFEEADLWGKDLYSHLSEIYQTGAMFTVIFVSRAYSEKVWTNHERKAAQARALGENREYVLPAFFDEEVEVPGLLRTTHYIALANRTPEQLAELIEFKLKNAGVVLAHQFQYSEEAKADIDFPLDDHPSIASMVKAMKTCNWYSQNPAVEKVMALDWKKISSDEAFVLGRNIYQCACGEERAAESFLDDLRRNLAKIPTDRALDFLNGMLFEVYFDSEGDFRGRKLKAKRLQKLLALQNVPRFEPSIMFIRRSLEPYSSELLVLPSTKPEDIDVRVTVKRTDPPVVKSLTMSGYELLSSTEEDDRLWRISQSLFTLVELRRQISLAWGIPDRQLKITCEPELDEDVNLRLPKGMNVFRPTIMRSSK